MLITLSSFHLFSQDEKIHSSNRSTLYGIGGTSILDSYLSPIRYTGTEIRIVNERNQFSKQLDGKLSIQNRLDLSLSKTNNPAETGTEYAGYIDWNWGYHYHFPVSHSLKLLAGGGTYASGGVIYNSRNTNNPISAKIGLGVATSGMALYNLNFKQQPFTIRTQFIIPLGGMMFAPEYGQSYYEIFGLGESGNTIKFSSLHNLFVCKSILSIDVPLKKVTIRVAYQNNTYISNANNLETKIHSNTFMIGFASEVVLINRKQPILRETINSAYY